MNKLFRLTVSLILVLTLATTNPFFPELPEPVRTLSVPEKIVKSIIRVGTASGVVIDSNDSNALVLTAYHVIEDFIDDDGNLLSEEDPIPVEHFYFFHINDEVVRFTLSFSVISLHLLPGKDLALLEISTKIKLDEVKLAIDLPELAEEIYIAGNPNYNYQSISRGAISSKKRYRGNAKLWQISGGITFGQSGGGAFNGRGELVAITSFMDTFNTGFCKEGDEIIGNRCLMFPIYNLGFFVSPRDIRDFLLSTKFKNRFQYLRE